MRHYLLFFFAIPSLSFAGLYHEFQTIQANGAKARIVTSVRGGVAKTEIFPDTSKTPVVTAFLEFDKNTTTTYFHADHTVARVTTAQLEALVKLTQESLRGPGSHSREMEALLGKLPAAQRAKVDRQIAQAREGAPEIAGKQISDGDKVAGRSCARFEEPGMGSWRTVTCYAPFADAHLPPADLVLVQKLAAYTTRLRAAVGRQAQDTLQMGDLRNGLAVEIQQFDGERLVSRGELVAFEHRDFPAAAFREPKGYREEKIIGQ